MTTQPLAHTYKRRRSYWEPVFAPETNFENFSHFNWELKNVVAIKDSYCAAEILLAQVKNNQRFTIKSFSFQTCDFLGKFNFTKLTFDKCSFKYCDFTDSDWHDAKFSECIFDSCSFSTSSFADCQFIKCAWKNMGVSSNEMKFSNCLITNPNDFVQSAYTNIDANLLAQKNTTPAYQQYRLEGTKAKIARMLLSNLEQIGDDDAFYDAVKCYTTQVLTAKIATANHNLKIEKLIKNKVKHNWFLLGYKVELFLLQISGRINGWGGNIGRAAVFGIVLIILFFLIYLLTGISNSFTEASFTAIEVTLLVGFTKYSSTSATLLHQLVFLINMLLGLWWYTIFVPTVVNRVNRVN